MDRSEEEARAGEVRVKVRPAHARWRRRLALLFMLLLALLVAAWFQRRTIARGFVDRELARRGVPARYEIEQLSPWRQRLTHVVIGDPRKPDLVADWIELRTALYPWRADLLLARVGTLRVRGRIVNGTLSLGSLDRLMPPPSGKPFTLPRLHVDIADARLRLESSAGVVDLGLRGHGLLTDGFVGALRVQGQRLRVVDCTLDGLAAQMQLRIQRGAPRLAGPAAAAQVACRDVRVSQPHIDVRVALDPGFTRWQGNASLGALALAAPFGRVGSLGGGIDFTGDHMRAEGSVALRSERLNLPQGKAASAAVSGRYSIGSGLEFHGDAAVKGAAAAPAQLAAIAAYEAAGQGTPAEPLARQLAQALRAAARRFDGKATVDFRLGDRDAALRLRQLDLAAPSGAHMRFGQGTGLGYALADGAIDLAGKLVLGGGGLPDMAFQLARSPETGALHGSGRVLPYAAGDAHMALSAIEFALRAGAGEVRSTATLSGPLHGGRVEGLSMPLLARWDAGTLTVNPGCARLAFSRIIAAGMVLNAGRISLCPLGPAMVQWRGKRMAGGFRATRIDLAGTMGGSPLRLSSGGAEIDLGTGRFGIRSAAVRAGEGAATRLDIGLLRGSIEAGPGGTFEGLSGQIGAVPLVLSQGKGKWQMAQGDLSLLGGFLLSDAAPSPRFVPVAAPNGRLRLHGGVIDAQADLAATKRQVSIGKVTIGHDLANGAGWAVLDVPGIRFHTEGLQPNDLTPLTYGVIADVDGLVSGHGRFAWSGDAVTSSGSFTATDMALAAAFGPVQGLTTQVDFTDLLNVRTGTAQVARVAEINPGVSVRDGVFRYQLLDSRRVAVEGARWPFAGGELILDPTILDFNDAGERRMTFHVKGVDAALFLKEMAFDNLDATGVFDGTLPMIFDANGGRIEGGELRARAGGHIAYVGEVSQRNLGVWGNMAFQALKSLDYKNLTLRMNGPLAGEMITDIRFSGLSQGKGTKSNFLIRRLARLPFVFNVRINAPFRQLLDSVQSWYDPRRLIERNLPALIEEQKRAQEAAKPAIQPRESAPVP